MSLTFSSNPIDDDDGTYGGYAEVARYVSRLNPNRPQGEYSRQAVNGWYLRRGSNNFPEPYTVRVKSGKVRQKFRISEVDEWFRLHRGTEAPTDEAEPTSPLFRVDGHGNAIY